MENKLRNVFDKIHAEDALKEKTANYLYREIRKRSRTNRTPRMRFAVVCASFVLLLLVGGFPYNLYFTPSAYVDMDVNPSIELTLNRFGRVLESYPYNDDGATILQGIDVRYKTYEQAIRTMLDKMIQQGYLKPDDLVSVTVQSSNGDTEQKLLGNIQTSVNTLLVSRHSTALADVFAVSQEVRNCAHGYNLSPAKYLAIMQLQEVDPTATFEDCAEHSISEIRRLTEEKHSGEHHSTQGSGIALSSSHNPNENEHDDGGHKEKSWKMNKKNH